MCPNNRKVPFLHSKWPKLIFNLQCVQKIRKDFFCSQNGQNLNKSGNEPFFKKFALLMWLLRELMIHYAYLQIVEYLYLDYSVSKNQKVPFLRSKWPKCEKVRKWAVLKKTLFLWPFWVQKRYFLIFWTPCKLNISILVSLVMHNESLAPLRATSKELIFFRTAHFLTFSHFGHFECKKGTFWFFGHTVSKI